MPESTEGGGDAAIERSVRRLKELADEVELYANEFEARRVNLDELPAVLQTLRAMQKEMIELHRQLARQIEGIAMEGADESIAADRAGLLKTIGAKLASLMEQAQRIEKEITAAKGLKDAINRCKNMLQRLINNLPEQE